MYRLYINVELRRLVASRAEHICDERILERQALIASGQYLSASALKQINK